MYRDSSELARKSTQCLRTLRLLISLLESNEELSGMAGMFPEEVGTSATDGQQGTGGSRVSPWATGEQLPSWLTLHL